MKVKIFRFIESKNLYENNISNQKVNQEDFDKYGDIINNFIEDLDYIKLYLEDAINYKEIQAEKEVVNND